MAKEVKKDFMIPARVAGHFPKIFANIKSPLYVMDGETKVDFEDYTFVGVSNGRSYYLHNNDVKQYEVKTNRGYGLKVR